MTLTRHIPPTPPGRAELAQPRDQHHSSEFREWLTRAMQGHLVPGSGIERWLDHVEAGR
jgi:hypothetical protein